MENVTLTFQSAAKDDVRLRGGMAWTKPDYSRRRVDLAGETLMAALASREDRELALVVINNWRSSHSFPLNTLTVNLRTVAADREDDPTVAQRIKRLPSIRHKLEHMPGMQLSRSRTSAAVAQSLGRSPQSTRSSTTTRRLAA